MWACVLLGMVVWLIAHDVLTETGERVAFTSPVEALASTGWSRPGAAAPPPAGTAAEPARATQVDPAASCTGGTRRTDEAISTGASERSRAAGLWLQSRLAIHAEALNAAVADDASCRQAQQSGFQETAQFCAEALGRTEAALLQAGAPIVDQLARLAASSRNAAVYALAYQACHPPGLSFHVPPAACRLLSLEQWAQLDTDNAVPWMHLALQAGAVQNRAGVDDALRRAGAARRVEMYSQVLVSAMADTDTPSPSATYLQAAESHCSAAALANTSRALVCESLARVLVSRSRNLADVLAGVQLGERLGWPADETSLISRTLRGHGDIAGSAPTVAPKQADPCAPHAD